MKKSNGQGSDEKFFTAVKCCGKVYFSRRVRFGGAVEKYVIICDFTGVDGIIRVYDVKFQAP